MVEKHGGSLAGAAGLSRLEGFSIITTLSKDPGERLCYNISQILSLYEVELSEFT